MSSLIDRSTVTVTYDARRGEPRSRLVPGAAQASTRGDCVDCHQCVTVCPTGIDIRNGVQLECVNCTACIDACDQVMVKVGRPTGLIRLTSHEAIETGRTRWLTGRVMAYAAVWLVLLSAVGVLIARRPDLDVLILRQPGTLFATLPGGQIANFYNVQVFNRTGHAVPFEIEVLEPAGVSVTPLGPLAAVGPHDLLEGRVLLTLAADTPHAEGAGVPVRFEVRVAGTPAQHIVSSFVAPPSHQRVERPSGGVRN